MEALLKQATEFLKNNQDINEVELQVGEFRVRLIRITPSPITYSGFWNSGVKW